MKKLENIYTLIIYKTKISIINILKTIKINNRKIYLRNVNWKNKYSCKYSKD